METLSQFIKQYRFQDFNYASDNTLPSALNEANCCFEDVCDYCSNVKDACCRCECCLCDCDFCENLYIDQFTCASCCCCTSDCCLWDCTFNCEPCENLRYSACCDCKCCNAIRFDDYGNDRCSCNESPCCSWERDLCEKCCGCDCT